MELLFKSHFPIASRKYMVINQFLYIDIEFCILQNLLISSSNFFSDSL